MHPALMLHLQSPILMLFANKILQFVHNHLETKRLTIFSIEDNLNELVAIRNCILKIKNNNKKYFSYKGQRKAEDDLYRQGNVSGFSGRGRLRKFLFIKKLTFYLRIF